MIRKQSDPKAKQTKITFVLTDYEDVGRVSVVGDFNGWTPERHKFVRRRNRTRSASVKLPAGHRFSFRYLAEGGHWFNDEAADG
ncbi:MAG: isoamylase early set domain-containing protein, partial [Acidobacteriota bacterium]